MVKVQLCFVSNFGVYAFGNQYDHERKWITIFAGTEYKIFDSFYDVQHSDKLDSVCGLYQMQNETESVESIIGNLEEKGYHLYTVGGHQNVEEV